METLDYQSVRCGFHSEQPLRVSKSSSHLPLTGEVPLSKSLSVILKDRTVYTRPLVKSLKRLFRKIVNREIRVLRRSGVIQLFSNRSGKKIQKSEIPVFKAITLQDIKDFFQAIVKYGARLRDRIGRRLSAKYKVKWVLDREDNEAFLSRKRRILETSMRKYGEGLEDTVRDILVGAASETKRPTMTEIARRIKVAALGHAGVLGENVAKRIAATEMASFQNYGMYQAYKKAKIKRIKWTSIIDSRTRPAQRRVPRANHIVIDGRETDLGVPFIMPITNQPMLYPGDPMGSIYDIVNCRCTVVPVPKPKR